MAGLFRKFFGHFGHRKEDGGKKARDKAGGAGFSMKVAVPSDNTMHAPVVSRCTYGHGGVQGLTWYSEKLRVDDDGDVAQEFLSEVIPETPGASNTPRSPRFEAVRHTRPVKLKGPVCTQDGNVRQFVELSGEHLWA